MNSMSWSHTLNRLEAGLQGLIEGGLTRLFSGYDLRHDLHSRLQAAMQAGLQTLPGGGLLAPNQFTLLLPAAHAQVLAEHPEFLTELANGLGESARQYGWQIHGDLTVHAAALSASDGPEPRILAQTSQAADGSTLTEVPVEAGPARMIVSAYLIVNGVEFFPLHEPILNIGRGSENHLVLEDGRVSRQHAQLRYTNGRYLLFDLNSTGGTLLNGAPVSQAVLQAGDVISLAGFPLVFGVEQQAEISRTDRLPEQGQPPLDIIE